MPYVEIGGRTLFYTRTGGKAQAEPALLLLHGAGGSRLDWPPQLRRLAGVTVYTLDLPGHGRSPGPGHDRLPAMADDVAAFMERLALRRVVVAGYSMGAAIAQLIGLRAPEAVVGLILIGAGARLRVLPALFDWIREDFAAAVDFLSRHFWSDSAPEELVALSRQKLSQVDPDQLYADFVACDAFDVRDRLDQIRLPTLVIGAAEDKLAPLKLSRFLAERLPDARLAVIENAGHMMALEQPERVARLVGDFVRIL